MSPSIGFTNHNQLDFFFLLSLGKKKKKGKSFSFFFVKFQYQFGLSLSSWGMLAELIFVYFNPAEGVKPKFKEHWRQQSAFMH